MAVDLDGGAALFARGLDLCGNDCEVRNQILVFSLIPVTGIYVGKSLETGVALNELVGWPAAPPHWVHFPSAIDVGPTNAKPSPVGGWLMHSRALLGWGNAQEPAQAWLAHVQSVLEVAQAA